MLLPSRLKNEGDVVKLVEQFRCGEESGHLNKFWVLVAGLVEINLCEELLCAIVKMDIQTVTGKMQAMGKAFVNLTSPSSGESGDCQGDARQAPWGVTT